jgi:uncharacterized membrane protein
VIHDRPRLHDHPLQAFVAAVPIVFYASTVIALIAHAVASDPFWFRFALTVDVAGALTALIAALPVAIDLFASDPEVERTRSTEIAQLGLHLAAIGLFGVTAVLLWDRWYLRDSVRLDGTAPLGFAIGGLVAAIAEPAIRRTPSHAPPGHHH